MTDQRHHSNPDADLDDHLYGNESPPNRQRDAFLSGAFPVAVYGLGKMGLPLAAVFADATGNVIGADTDPTVVETIDDGDCHVKREPELPSLVAETVAEGALTATTRPSTAAKRASVHVVIVPTPITEDNEPDLAILNAVVEAIGAGLDRGDLVLVESTVPPRTTADRVLPTLEDTSGLARGDFGLAFCPERTSSGRALADIRGAYPKVVGGVDGESTRAATLVYGTINDKGVIPASDSTTAEAVKVFEGVYRDVNIALANELATFADEFGIDVREAINVANTQPYCDLHEPGPGVGGHCIPFYPYFVIAPFETDAPLLRTARRINDAMPAYTVDKLREMFAAERTAVADAAIVLLGLTYRPGVEEIRASPSLALAEQLSAVGADVYGVDPMLESFDRFEQRGLTPLDLESMYDYQFDGIVLVTPHDEFKSLRWENLKQPDGNLIVLDGRNALDREALPDECRVYTLGTGSE